MEQTIATIVNFDELDTRIRITDADGTDYSFFKRKLNGEETEAFKSWKDLKVDIKDKVRMNYTVNGNFNNIMSFISKN